MNLLGLAVFWQEGLFSRDLSPMWVPVVGTIAGTLMVVAIVAIVMNAKQQMQRLDYELHLRRMDHERRMKELEVELAKARGTSTAA